MDSSHKRKKVKPRKEVKLKLLTIKQKNLMRAYDNIDKKTGSQKKFAYDIRTKTIRAIEDLSWLAKNVPKSQFKQIFVEDGLFVKLVRDVTEGGFRTLPEGEAIGFAVRMHQNSDLQNYLPDLSEEKKNKR